jgi:hypothetical protein
MREYLFILGLFAGFAFAHWAPVRIKRRHVKAQDRLIERCRAHYLLALERLRLGQEEDARDLLARIRRLERHWRFGNSAAYRVALAGYAVWVGYVGNALLRAGGIVTAGLLGPAAGGFTVEWAWDDIFLFAIISASGAVWALSSYLGPWTQPWIVDDCGDRLERRLNAGSALSNYTEQSAASLDGLSPKELFGLGYGFSLRELKAARRRLATKFHPDLWSSATLLQRRAAEAAMQHVNAAYDELKGHAT